MSPEVQIQSGWKLSFLNKTKLQAGDICAFVMENNGEIDIRVNYPIKGLIR
jgi:hypothetical protein